MPTTILNDPGFLKEQYTDSTRLGTRLDLHKRFSVNPVPWHVWVFDRLLDLPPHCRILELGCGAGALWEENLQRIPPGWQITLSDFSSGMLESTQRKLEKLHPFQFKPIDAQIIPYEAVSFDAVIANHMLYHVPDIPKALSEIRRVLVPGGHFFAATNGRQHLAELSSLLVRFDSELTSWSPARSPFRIEDAATHLSPWFTEIRLEQYHDALEITEVEPLLEYVLSTSARSRVLEKQAAFKELLCQEMETGGGRIHITKSGGLFTCIRREIDHENR